jgi:hypothetical protein
MKVARLKFNDGHQPYMEGNFGFYMSSGCGYHPIDFAPVKNITFQWSPEVGQDLLWAGGNRVLAEVIAEQLKQDFIEFIMSYEPELPEPITRETQPVEGADIAFAALIDTDEVEDGRRVMTIIPVFMSEMGKIYEWVNEEHKIVRKIQ